MVSSDKLKVLITPPTLDLNDTHNYHGGAIGNISYNLLCSLADFNAEIYAIIKSRNLAFSPPSNLKLYPTGGKMFERAIGGSKQTNKILKKEKIDVITQLYFFYGVSFNPMLRKVKDYPFVIGMCELPHPLLEDEIGSGMKKYAANLGKKFLFPLFKKTLDYCDTLIAVNEGAKDLYSNLMPRSKIRVIPYGVDLERFKYSSLPSNHNILAVSRLIKRRGLDYLVEAMPIILKEYPDANLHFVGDGPRKGILQAKAKELGVSSKVIFHGNVSANELVNLYRNCYVFCHLSSADGWNQPALEAMASGRPVICTDAPHNSMVIDKKTGFLIPYGDIDVLAEKIRKVLGDRELAGKMGLEGRKEAEEKYNWDEVGRRYYEVYKEVAR
ncbi:MAG: Glycosyltransferase Gtf1 [Candidatus Methanoperedenaceae archaeon GB50]|nr:MAG: Glycosyltransferase Gtf1 [Candidatus Methanoperedenaceae archaeon GB50]